MTDDRDLRENFDALRREDAGAAPAFDPIWDAAARRRSSRRFTAASGRALWAAASVVVIAGAAILYRGASPPEAASEDVARAFAEWRAPTDFLLRTPGRELLETVPRVSVDLPTGLIDGIPRKGSTVTPSPPRR